MPELKEGIRKFRSSMTPRMCCKYIEHFQKVMPDFSKVNGAPKDWTHVYLSSSVTSISSWKSCGATASTWITCYLQLQVRTRQQVKTMQPHTESTSTHSSTQAWTQANCAYIFLYLNPSSITVVPNNLASHAHVILPSHIVFLHFKTLTQLRIQWHEHTQVTGTQ